jgi:hypothetical protein
MEHRLSAVGISHYSRGGELEGVDPLVICYTYAKRQNMDCPNCGEALSERGSFCKFCGGQARCMNCKEVLEPFAAACVECGTKIGASAGAKPQNGGGYHPPQAPRNKITYREDQNGRNLDADFSDSTMQAFGDVLGFFFASRGVGQQPANSRLSFREQSAGKLPGKALPAPPNPNTAVLVDDPPEQKTDLAHISEVFQPNGEELELIESRLKAKSGRDYVRRLTYLCLYANELHGRQWTAKSSLIAILKDGKVWDPNASRWLSTKQGFREDGEERLQLIKGGRDDAQKALLEVVDPSVTDDWHPDRKKVAKRGPRKKRDNNL